VRCKCDAMQLDFWSQIKKIWLRLLLFSGIQLWLHPKTSYTTTLGAGTKFQGAVEGTNIATSPNWPTSLKSWSIAIFNFSTTATISLLCVKVLLVKEDDNRSGHIALVAGPLKRRWILATENMKVGDIITNSAKPPQKSFDGGKSFFVMCRVWHTMQGCDSVITLFSQSHVFF